MSIDYAELHCLSNFSFQRGASSALELFQRAKKQGYQALAITDECTLAGIVRAWQAAKAVELPLIISDHADWDELTATIAEVAREEVWITHGREEGLLRWAELNGVKARALALVGYEDEDEEDDDG